MSAGLRLKFLDILEANASLGIGFTLMGVGIDHDADLVYDISHLRDGDAYFLADADRIASIFGDDFNSLVTPAAHDLTIDILIPEGVDIAAVHGIPDYEPGTGGARIHVPTLFLSKREGGGSIMARLTLAAPPPEDEAFAVAEVSIAYTLADDSTESSEFQVSRPKPA